ncbi:MAG: ABC transporter, partial [Mesorhizobium sp.]
DQMTIPVGVKDTDAAYALLNAYLGKQSQEVLTQTTSYTPINNEAQPKVDASVAAFLTNTPDRQSQGYKQNIKFWVENFQAAQEKWSAMMAGN